MKYCFISQHQTEFPVELMCHLLKVARSSFYAYYKRSTKAPSIREEQNKVLLGKIKVIFEGSKQRYGSPRIHASLKQQGNRCSLGRVKRLMIQAGLYAVNAKKYIPKQEKAEVTETKNLLLEPANRPTAINQVWHSDITYIPTDEGWLYLAGVMDGYSLKFQELLHQVPTVSESISDMLKGNSQSSLRENIHKT